MPIHTLDLADPTLEQILPRPEPLDPPPQPNTTLPSPIDAVLSDALRFKEAQEHDRMVLRDQHDRVLCIHKSGTDWGWAYLGALDDYSADIAPLFVQLNTSEHEVVLIADEGLHDWSFFANGKSTEWEYVFAGWKPWHEYPRLRFKARLSGTTIVNEQEVRIFNLGFQQGATRMVLHAAQGAWNWLKVTAEEAVPREQLCRFTLHKLIVPVSKVSALIKQTWPNATLNTAPIASDRYYEAISEQQAKRIWGNAKLLDYRYRPEVFDCDDFAMAYKSQAAKDAYAQTALHPYAVGIVLGRDKAVGHAANLFISQQGHLCVIEPQTGAVQRATEWRFTPEYVIM